MAKAVVPKRKKPYDRHTAADVLDVLSSNDAQPKYQIFNFLLGLVTIGILVVVGFFWLLIVESTPGTDENQAAGLYMLFYLFPVAVIGFFIMIGSLLTLMPSRKLPRSVTRFRLIACGIGLAALGSIVTFFFR